MFNQRIATERNYQTWPSWDVVYEWEDVFAKLMKVDFHYLSNGRVIKLVNKVFDILNVKDKLTFSTHKTKWKLMFIMDAKYLWRYTKCNIIPIFLDASYDDVNLILNSTRKLPCYWVTSFDLFTRLKELDINTSVHYMPLSISDVYYTEIIAPKDIDVIQFGRKNQILHDYMMRYCEIHPDINYVYQTKNGSLTYVSTINGNMGTFSERQDYFKLLQRSKVSLVSSPGYDKGRDFGGLDFFTPRFYESAINYCYMLGRYTKNVECKLLNIESVCTYVDTFKEFKAHLDKYLLDQNFLEKEKYDSFIKANLTSMRVCSIVEILKENGFSI